MAKLSFKVYLVNEDPWTEVRRFGIDADVATNFVYLREKLQTIFPDLRGKSFTVTWKGEFLCDPLFFPFRIGERSSEFELTSASDVVYQRSRVTFCALIKNTRNFYRNTFLCIFLPFLIRSASRIKISICLISFNY